MTRLKNATVLITGGTGSFGATFARHALDSGAGEVRIFSRDEFKQSQLRNTISDQRVRFFLGDVRSLRSLLDAMVGVDLVFHAAALKQVPSCEFFPHEATETNVVGSGNVIRAANEAGVQSLVCLSTDKAVYPVNAMGMTKGLMEKTALAFARSYGRTGTVVSIVRYGNVLYSRGSVVPLFVDQIQRGLDITLTDPNMTRFLMTLDQSVDLVSHALEYAEPGDLFVRKVPAATVQTLAEAVCDLMQTEFRSRIIGVRHGEKIFETLLSREELSRSIIESDYFRVPMDARSLDYESFFDRGDPLISGSDDYTSHNTTQLDVSEVGELIRSIPEFQADVAQA